MNTIKKMIQVGQTLPLNIKLGKCLKPAADGSCPVAPKCTSGELFQNKRVVLFALPGAFTPTCSAKHLPGFIQHSSTIKSKNIDEIYCLSTNDSFVMSAWGKEQGAGDAVTLISDGNSEFTREIGMILDATGFLMGPERTKRYAMIVDNGVVKHIGLDEKDFEKSSAESILKEL